jgi:hypothetical protein
MNTQSQPPITPTNILEYMDILSQKPIEGSGLNISYDKIMELIDTLSNDLEVFYSRDIIMKKYLNDLSNEMHSISTHPDYTEAQKAFGELTLAYDQITNKNLIWFRMRVVKIKEYYNYYEQSHKSRMDSSQIVNNFIPEQISYIENNNNLKRKSNNDRYMENIDTCAEDENTSKKLKR